MTTDADIEFEWWREYYDTLDDLEHYLPFGMVCEYDAEPHREEPED